MLPLDHVALAIDYTLVGIALTFALTFIWTLLGFESPFPKNVVFYLFGTICSFFCGQLCLMAYSATYPGMLPLSYLFWMFAVIDFILFIAAGTSSLRMAWVQRKKRRYGFDEDEDVDL